MKKKITAIVLCVAMLAVAVAGSTMAYFMDTDSKTNVVVIGNVDATLYESKYHRGAYGGYLQMDGQPKDLTDADIIADDADYADYLAGTTLMPFDLSHKVQDMFEECTVAKNAYVKNTSQTNDCFVRVRYMIPADIAPYLDIFYVNTQFISADDEIATADARTLNNEDKSEPVITVANPNGANFTLQGATLSDDKEYYYMDFIYAERLTPGEMTLYSPISKITMIPSVTAETIAALNLTNRQFDIEVEAHVIQADGFLNALEAFKNWSE